VPIERDRVSMRRKSGGRLAVLALAGVGATGAALGLRAEQRQVAAELARPRDLHGADHAGAAQCARCHPEHVASWRRTFHRPMTQDVSAAQALAVAGDFSGVTYRYGGTSARMHRDAAGQFVMTFAGEGPGGGPVEAVVVRAVGSRRYQQYLASVGGALWRLPMAFHIEERRWFHMNGAFLTPDPDGQRDDDPPGGSARPRFGGGAYDRHVTRWNDNCVFCHNVAPNPGRALDGGSFRTTVAELGVACEGCHGPGAEHARVNGNPLRRYALHGSAAADPTIVNPARLSPARAADVCGRCHGQRISDDVRPFLEHGDPFVPGDDLALYTAPLWRDTPLGGDRQAFAARFWDDGTPRLTAYEYQGMLQSRCAQTGGLTCTTCHGMHEGDPRGQVRPAAAGDRACTGCHAGLATPAAAARHTRHLSAGPGARCGACHMPRLVYGVLDVHPSHRIEIPEPARAQAAGRPDACTLCHVERDRGWAIRERARLWPGGGAAPDQGHPSDDGSADLSPRSGAFGGDPIVRAVSVDAMGRAPWPEPGPAREGIVRARAGTLLEVVDADRYPAVRHLAARALGAVFGRWPGHDEEAAAARTYDATAPAAERARVVADLRRRLARGTATGGGIGGGGVGVGGVIGRDDLARMAAWRAAARQVDIDIGE
jgi:hypothetical protein